MRLTIIPSLGRGQRIREIRPDGNKLLLDVAGRPVVLRHLDVVLPDAVTIAVPPSWVGVVREVTGTSASVVGYRAVDAPWGLACFLADMVYHLPPDDTVSVLFCDTLFAPGTDYRALTRPHTVVVQRVADGGRFLNVETENGKVTGWVDHPHDGKPALATVGLYTLPAGEWQRALDAWDDDNAGYRFLYRAAFDAVETDSWLDVGTVESYRATCARFLGRWGG